MVKYIFVSVTITGLATRQFVKDSLTGRTFKVRCQYLAVHESSRAVYNHEELQSIPTLPSMSSLRQRFLSSRPSSPSPSPTPPNSESNAIGEELKLVSSAKLQELKKGAKRAHKRGHSVVFILGGLFGVLLALFFAQNQEVINFEGILDLNLESLIDVIPAGVIKDAKDLTQPERDAVNYDSFSVGLHLQSQGIKALHPVIMVPGVISTGLESWGTEEASRQYFRKRLWGSWTMMRALVMDKAGWKRHIMLDKKTGLDPAGIKLRAAQGFDAADFFITGYWIWNKILQNLATIGYDPVCMWRFLVTPC